MAKKKKTVQPVPDETVQLKNQLEETEETLRAIRQYMVDAFVVSRSNGVEVVTLSDAGFPYRLMVESMNEGAVTLISDGTIFYCNPRFSEMVGVDGEKLIGVRFQDLILPAEQQSFEELFKQAGRNSARGEFCLQPPGGDCVPVHLSIYRLEGDHAGGMAILATDISQRVQAEEKIRSLATQLTVAEQEERQRISQILHDDLQQRLFAIKTHLVLLLSENRKSDLSAVAREDLKQIQLLLSDVIGITRSLSVDLSPNILQGEGLAEAVLWLAAQMKTRHGLQVELHAKDNLSQLNNHMRILLFQTIRELLFNVVKHAGTSQATITLERQAERGRITISDAGRGFDGTATMTDPKTAHGLLVIRDQLGLMGCSMDITSGLGKGTQIVIEIPLPENPAS